MILAGLQKTSLIDFPDKICCVVFVTGCNFTCPFCHNPELARGRFPQRITQDQFLAFLEPRRTLLDGVAISGGEPTLSPGLAALCRAIRELGLAIKLDTNGSRPQALAGLIEERLLDCIAMDVKTDLSHYGPPLVPAEEAGPIGAGVGHRIHQRIHQSIQLIMSSGLDYEFRTTCVRPFVDETIIIDIAQAIQGARRYVLQPFRDVSLLAPTFFAGRVAGFTPVEMEALRASAAPWVAACLIRS